MSRLFIKHVGLLLVLILLGTLCLFFIKQWMPQKNPPTQSSVYTNPASVSTNIPATKITQKSSEDISGLDLSMGTNTTVLLTDPQGRRTGRDPQTGIILQDIPNSAYFEDHIDNMDRKQERGTSHSIEIFQPLEGEYHLVLIGLKDGPFKIKIRAFSIDGSSQPTILEKGYIESESQIKFTLHVRSRSGTASTLTRMLD